MRFALIKEIIRQTQVLDSLIMLARRLPDSGPEPWHVSLCGKGDIIYSAKFNNAIVAQVQVAFGAHDWQQERRRYSRGIDYVKRLDDGIQIKIEDAEPVPDAAEVLV